MTSATSIFPVGKLFLRTRACFLSDDLIHTSKQSWGHCCGLRDPEDKNAREPHGLQGQDEYWNLGSSDAGVHLFHLLPFWNEAGEKRSWLYTHFFFINSILSGQSNPVAAI